MSILRADIDEDEVKKRYRYAWEAKQDELDRLEQAYLWVYEFEDHLKQGEEGRAAYRFPELLGYCLRRYNRYIGVLLPEAKVTGENDASVGLQAAIDHYHRTSNINREKLRAIKDACFVGSGCIALLPCENKRYNRETGKWYTSYRGVSAERVDWRYIYPAPGSTLLHDHTGSQNCPYLFRKKIYHIDTFRRLFSDPKFKNINDVEPTTWGNSNIWADSEFLTRHEVEEVKNEDIYVTILEYWDQENDIMQIYASGGIKIYESPRGIPLSHKQLPFHVYYNLKRTDSINGIGEIELNMPYNLFREKIMNLGIDDITLRVQPAKIVDGWIEFNPEEKELEGGAVFTAKGPGVLDDIRRHIMDFNAGGGVDESVMSMIQMIENSRIAVTADDTTALYANPSQLATQTLAKRETLNENIDASIKENTNDTEFYLTNQLASLIKNELSVPYRDDDGAVRYNHIKINGYDRVQDDDDKPVKFAKMRGKQTSFALNKKVSELFDKAEIEILEAKRDDQLKQEKIEKLTVFFQTVFGTIGTLAQYSPQMLEDIFKDMDLKEFMRIMAKQLGVRDDLDTIFPPVMKESLQIDLIDAEHKQIMMGITPEIREDEESIVEYMEHMEFANSAFFKENADKDAKKAMEKHLNLTSQNVITQVSKPVTTRQKELDEKQRTGGGEGIQRTSGQFQDGAPPSGAGEPVPMAGNAVPEGDGRRPDTRVKEVYRRNGAA